MFNNILRLFLLVVFMASLNQGYGAIDPNLPGKEKEEIKGDSLNIDKSDNKLKDAEVKAITSHKAEDTSSSKFFERDQEVEEDSTSSSALSFNFIYYIIEKFKFQVE